MDVSDVSTLAPASRCRVAVPASPAQWAEAAALVHDHVTWMRAACGFEPLDAQPELVTELADVERHYTRPEALLLLARTELLAVGVVGLRWHGDGSTELKRMYVRPMARGSGAADALVDAAMSAAADRGVRKAWLETKRGPMDRAIAVYRRHGFVPTSDDRRTLAIDDIVVMERAVRADRRCA